MIWRVRARTKAGSPAERTAAGDDWRGAGLMLLAMAGYAFNDLMVKIVSSDLSAATILTRRSALAVMFLLLIMGLRHELAGIGASMYRRILLRSMADAGVTMFYVYALTGLSLANAAAIYQLTPIIFMLAKRFLFHEAISLGSWIGAATGFCGMLLVVRPSGEILDTYAIAAAMSVACSVLRDLLMPSRMMLPAFHLAFLSAVLTMMLGLGLAGGASTFVVPSLQTLLPLTLAAAGIAFGYVFMARATSTGNGGFVSPFRYSILIYAVVFGALILGDRPDTLALAGIGMILIGGVVVGVTRNRQNR